MSDTVTAASGTTVSVSADATGADKPVEGETLTFDGWYGKLPEEQKALIETHTKGLKSALESERGSRKDLEKQIRDLAGKAEKGSEAQTQLTRLADDLQKADTRADFYEAAHAAGVKNLKLAYQVAQIDEMFDKHGRVNFNVMKESYPELFAGNPTLPRGDAGSGTQSKPKTGASMNDFIRKSAGKA
jgi:hypothetical protein